MLLAAKNDGTHSDNTSPRVFEVCESGNIGTDGRPVPLEDPTTGFTLLRCVTGRRLKIVLLKSGCEQQHKFSAAETKKLRTGMLGWLMFIDYFIELVDDTLPGSSSFLPDAALAKAVRRAHAMANEREFVNLCKSYFSPGNGINHSRGFIEKLQRIFYSYKSIRSCKNFLAYANAFFCDVRTGDCLGGKYLVMQSSQDL